jgi:hypothetical protein
LIKVAGERTSKIAWGARAPVRRKAKGVNPDHPAWGGKRPGAGRPKGAPDRKPRKPGLAFVNELRDYGLDPDAPPETKRLVNLAVDRVADVICERVPAALSPSVLKGSAMVIEMLCQRAAGGEGSLVSALAQVHERIKVRALLAPAASDVPPPPDVADVEFREIPATTPADPPPPSRQERAAALYRGTREARERKASTPTREELNRIVEEGLERRSTGRCVVEPDERDDHER